MIENLYGDPVFFGRENELSQINAVIEEEKKERRGVLIGVDGVRRVGKTTIVNKYIKERIRLKKEEKEEIELLKNDIFLRKKESSIDLNDDVLSKIKIEDGIYFKFVGVYGLSSQQNLIKTTEDFAWQIKELCESEVGRDFELNPKNLLIDEFKKVKTWGNFFNLFNSVLYRLKTINSLFNFYVFFDEISWYSKQNIFIKNFAAYWNKNGCEFDGLVIFMATSVSSWSNKVFMDNAALFQRFRLVIKLKPFDLKEIKAYLTNLYKGITNKEVIHLYFMFGGIIQYYKNWMRGGATKVGNFEETLLFIQKNKNKIIKEYDNLFDGVFLETQKDLLKEIVKTICESKSATFDMIKNKIKYEKEDKILYEQLNTLTDFGFLVKSKLHDKNKYNYTLNHQFAYFVNYWILSGKENLLTNLDQNFSTWKSNMFELTCYQNLHLTSLENLSNNNQENGDYKFLNRYIYQKDIDKKISNLNKSTTPKKDDGKINKIIAQIDILIDKTKTLKRIEKTKNYYSLIECKAYFEENSRLSIDKIKEINNKADYLELDLTTNRNTAIIEVCLLSYSKLAYNESVFNFPVINICLEDLF